MSVLFKVKTGKSNIDGTGLYALTAIPVRRKIGELTGEIISLRAGRALAKNKKRIALVELDEKRSLNAESDKAIRYINHSCAPNTYMRILGHHVEFYALRAIKKGEELTCNYGETHHDGKMPCRCGAVNCKGYL